MFLGFETLNLKFRDLKLWKLTVVYDGQAPRVLQDEAAVGGACNLTQRTVYYDVI